MGVFWSYFLEILPGLRVTVLLCVLTAVLSIPLGFLLSLVAGCKSKILRGILSVYTWLMRGTPLLLQIIFIYYGLPIIATALNKEFGWSLNWNLPDFTTSLVAFTLNYAAYFSEIFRGGISSIDSGQYEASSALGLGKAKTLCFVIIPQMLRRVLPPVANETINLVKDTSLVAILAVTDVFYATKLIVMRNGNLAPFLIAAVLYLAMVLLLTFLQKKLEDKFNFSKR